MRGGFYASGVKRKREWDRVGDGAEKVGTKKDFRRGGSIPPPEVRHGLNSRLLTNLESNRMTDSTSVTIPLPYTPVN